MQSERSVGSHQKRPSQILLCNHYHNALSEVKKAAKANDHVWLEAAKPEISTEKKLASHQPDIAYMVHGSKYASDVPSFAVEVYERGALSRYETDREKIQQLANMSEPDRIIAWRSDQARAQADVKFSTAALRP